jgi:predicted nucleotide-binding protein (sugar kinase/HSP70/actin superfamily)
MYWYYGQLDMKACAKLRYEPNVFVTFISNFSCAPDSFMLHYLKWMMGTKPFLVLEFDSHTADAGIDTRVEAFLDIVEGYRTKYKGADETRYDNGLRFMTNGRNDMFLQNIHTGQRIEIKGNPQVKILLSNMGRLSTEILAAAMRSYGVHAEAMPVPDVYTLQLARNHASGKECLPSHLVLGSALKYFSSGKYRKDEIYLLFVPTTKGPCRTGQYFVFYENLFKDLRLENVVVFTLDSDNSYNELGADFSKKAWWAIVAGDYMKDIETSLRTCAADVKSAMQIYDALWRRLISVAEVDVRNILPTLKEIASEISKIPLKKSIDQCPKVLIVGEIYVRRDDFAVDELIQHFSRRGIIGKVSGITEWVYYCDFVREYELKKKLSLYPWYRRMFTMELRELMMYKIEMIYKHRVDHRVKNVLSPTALVPDTPHDMYHIMDIAEKNFTTHELHSEIVISSGVAATAMAEGFSGIVNISPFACLIGRVIEGLYTPWARERRYPVMSIEIDGNLFPPGVVSKLEIFMLNVLRFKENPDISLMVEKEGQVSNVVDRKIIVE